MTKRWMMGAAAAALTVAGAFAAQAADLPTHKEAPAPMFVPPPFTWTGFYVGLNAGGVWGGGSATSTLYNNFGFPLITNNFPVGSIGNANNTGFIGGAQAGYNWQTGAFVVGAEADFDWTSMSRHRNIYGPSFVDFNGLTDSFALNSSVKQDWLGTIRGRVGFVATPDNRLMFYGTGGLAYGGTSAHLSIYDTNNGWLWYGNRSNTRTGWTIGAGVEYAITNNVTIRGEYLYYNLGSTNAYATPNTFASNVWPGVFATTKLNFDGSILRAGVNYKF